jgi:glycine/D-amino acid oxidase-like deaminating enzyme
MHDLGDGEEMEQYSFDWDALDAPEPPDPESPALGRGSIQQAFLDFDEAHPEVYEYLMQLTREVQQRGFRHYGIGAMWERMRWHFQIEKGMDEEFKLNNNFRSRYARKIMKAHPDLEDFFELRILRAD